ncbi:MAG TPA: DUF2993 domain-containing protein, partial [Terriglobales bacterium]|nr:DUF2993 domain-containing protein [Terriglobales bacterium]
LRAGDRRRRLGFMAVSLVIAGAIALPWYGPRVLGLPTQIAHRSFKFAAQEAQAEYLSAESLLYYPLVLPSQLGPLATVLFLWGLVAARRLRASRALLWLAGVAPFVLFSLIQNRNVRYTLPVLPAAALLAAVGARSLPSAWCRGAAWAGVIVGLLQVSMAAFALPPPPRVPGMPLPIVFYQPPSRADWRHDALLSDLARASGGRPATVSVVPNYNFFSVSNFRYDAARLGLPFTMIRSWSGPPLGVDFVIAKTGSQGPSWTVERPERLTRALDGGDPYLAEIFPVVGRYPLPDGSEGVLRQRRIPALAGVTPGHIAARLSEAPAAMLRANVRDAVGLRVGLSYQPDGILRGEVEQVRIIADAAVVGELDRKNRAPLALHDLRLVVDGLVFNPRRLVETGLLEVLDVAAIRVERAVLTQDDLDQFLRGQPAGAGMTVRLGDGVADVLARSLGPTIHARLRLVNAPGDRPIGLAVDSVRWGGLQVPGFLTDWIVRHFDPTLALRRLPVPVAIAPIRIVPGRIEIGT